VFLSFFLGARVYYVWRAKVTTLELRETVWSTWGVTERQGAMVGGLRQEALFVADVIVDHEDGGYSSCISIIAKSITLGRLILPLTSQMRPSEPLFRKGRERGDNWRSHNR
jgi:hypothetical protein